MQTRRLLALLLPATTIHLASLLAAPSPATAKPYKAQWTCLFEGGSESSTWATSRKQAQQRCEAVAEAMGRKLVGVRGGEG